MVKISEYTRILWKVVNFEVTLAYLFLPMFIPRGEELGKCTQATILTQMG